MGANFHYLAPEPSAEMLVGFNICKESTPTSSFACECWCVGVLILALLCPRKNKILPPHKHFPAIQHLII